MSTVKTTLEIPDSLFRRAKAIAARRGQTMTAFVTSAVQSKLNTDSITAEEKPWMAYAGVFEREQKKSRGMLKVIEEACGQVHPEDWK